MEIYPTNDDHRKNDDWIFGVACFQRNQFYQHLSSRHALWPQAYSAKRCWRSFVAKMFWSRPMAAQRNMAHSWGGSTQGKKCMMDKCIYVYIYICINICVCVRYDIYIYIMYASMCPQQPLGSLKRQKTGSKHKGRWQTCFPTSKKWKFPHQNRGRLLGAHWNWTIKLFPDALWEGSPINPRSMKGRSSDLIDIVMAFTLVAWI